MNRLRLPLCLLLLLLVSYAPQAQPDAGARPEPRQFNFLIYYMGSCIGWVKSTVSEIEYEGRDVRHEHETAYVQIKRSFDGMTFESESVTEYWYETDGSIIREVDTTTNGGQTTRVEVEYAQESAVITETIDKGKPVKSTLKYEGKTVMGEFRAWRKLREDDLEQGQSLSFWSVEGDEHTLLQQTWTLSGRVQRKLSDKQTVEGTEVRIVKGGRAVTLVMGDDEMPLLVDDIGGTSLERVKEIPEPFKPERVSLRNTMNANVAITQFKQLTQLDIHFAYEHDDGEGIEPIAESNDYHDVVKYEKGYAIRMKSRRLTREFKSPKYPLEEVPEDVSKFLTATAMCQSDDEVLAGEARRLAKGKRDALAVARAIMRFTDRRLDKQSGSTGSASARQAYDERTGDCTEHAALFVALCRAAGLPARNIGGFVYACSPDGSVSIFGYHAWAEVWLGEWVPVDATVNEFGTSARYVCFEIDEPGEPHGRSRSSRCIRQNIKPMIDAYQLADGTSWRRKGATDFDWE
jgi:transglutaminase-like putative cysteine protease